MHGISPADREKTSRPCGIPVSGLLPPRRRRLRRRRSTQMTPLNLPPNKNPAIQISAKKNSDATLGADELAAWRTRSRSARVVGQGRRHERRGWVRDIGHTRGWLSARKIRRH